MYRIRDYTDRIIQILSDCTDRTDNTMRIRYYTDRTIQVRLENIQIGQYKVD